MLLAFAAQDGGKGLEDDFAVEQKAPTFDVLHIEFHVDVEGWAATRLDLPKTGQARLHNAAAQVLRLISNDIVVGVRTRSDDAHVAADDIPYLWELVDTIAANEWTETREPGIVVNLESRSMALVLIPQALFPIVCIRDHGTEFVTSKALPGLSDTDGTIECRTARIDLDHDGDEKGEGQKHDCSRNRDYQVEASLDKKTEWWDRFIVKI